MAMRLVGSGPLGNRWSSWYLCYRWYVKVLQVRRLHVGQRLSWWEWQRLWRLDGWRICWRLVRLVSYIRHWLRLKRTGVCIMSSSRRLLSLSGWSLCRLDGCVRSCCCRSVQCGSCSGMNIRSAFLLVEAILEYYRCSEPTSREIYTIWPTRPWAGYENNYACWIPIFLVFMAFLLLLLGLLGKILNFC